MPSSCERFPGPSQILHGRQLLAVFPDVEQLARVGGHHDVAEAGELERAGAAIGLDLDTDPIRVTHADDVEIAEAGRGAGAALAGGFEEAHGAVFEAGAFGFGVHGRGLMKILLDKPKRLG